MTFKSTKKNSSIKIVLERYLLNYVLKIAVIGLSIFFPDK